MSSAGGSTGGELSGHSRTSSMASSGSGLPDTWMGPGNADNDAGRDTVTIPDTSDRLDHVVGDSAGGASGLGRFLGPGQDVRAGSRPAVRRALLADQRKGDADSESTGSGASLDPLGSMPVGGVTNLVGTGSERPRTAVVVHSTLAREEHAGHSETYAIVGLTEVELLPSSSPPACINPAQTPPRREPETPRVTQAGAEAHPLMSPEATPTRGSSAGVSVSEHDTKPALLDEDLTYIPLPPLPPTQCRVALRRVAATLTDTQVGRVRQFASMLCHLNPRFRCRPRYPRLFPSKEKHG